MPGAPSGPHGVPATDSTDNNTVRDVVGSKADAAVFASASTKSLVAYVKGAIALLGRATTDTTANTYVSDVVGSKTDAAQVSVGTTRSLVAYIKGLVGRVPFAGSLHAYAAVVAPSGAGAFGAWTQVVAATGVDERLWSLSFDNAGINAIPYTIEVGVGAAAAEAAIATVYETIVPVATGRTVALPPILVASGSRIAVRAKNADGNNVNVALHVTRS